MIPDQVFALLKVYRTLGSVYLFCVFLLCFVMPLFGGTTSHGAEAEGYAVSLIAQSRALRLSEDRTWNILLHDKGGVSLIDDPKFFLAPDGKRNPQSELEATIAAFFEQERSDSEHPRCRFPLRYAWLKERLSIDESRLPAAACTWLNETLARMNPQSAVLVFPTTQNNSPASMFGHTLLRIGSSYESGLLSTAVTYAAYTEDNSGFAYAYKGIFGLYRGYYSVLPYYEKVNEYSDIERRDIWEYDLSLSTEETRRMVLHIWELKDVYSDYYFFDENCSYNLLFLLEAGRPSLHLTDRFMKGPKFWVIPSDTILAVQDAGLIKQVRYRPSQATRILAVASGLSDADQDLALDVVNQKISPQTLTEMSISAQEKMRILDLAAEILQYRYLGRQLEKEEYQKQFLAVLNARSSLVTSPVDLSRLPSPSPPEQGHLPGKFSLGMGYRTGSFFTEIGWRAAYHDLMDPDEGYTAGSQIKFFDVRGRYYLNDNKFQLESFRLIDIVSLAGRNKFFKPVSWKVYTGVEQELFADGQDHPVFRTNGGFGFAYGREAQGMVALMGEADLNFSGRLQDDYSLGFGPTLTALARVAKFWKVGLTATALFYRLGDEYRAYKGTVSQNFRLARNSGIDLILSREQTFGQYQTDIRASLNLYY